MSADGNLVLIMAPANDLHAKAVQAQIGQRGTARCLIVDLQDPLAMSVKHGEAAGLDTTAAVLRAGGDEVPLHTVKSIWMRRPRRWSAAQAVDPEFVEFAERNTQALVDGTLRLACQSGVNCVNEPDAEAAAMDKLWQLRVARACGIRTPETLASNCPTRAKAFIEDLWRRGREVIQKPARSARNQSYTQRISPDDLPQLSRLSVAPMQFQEFVRGTDLRVTVIGMRIFAAQIMPSGADTDVDWRRDARPVITETRLADADIERLLMVMRRLKLTYGAIDLKRLPDGSLVFLEVNPGGQFLFVEIDAGLDISGAIAEELVSDNSDI